MATYYVNSGAGGAATGADWANAFLTLQAGLTAASTAGDIVKVHYTHAETIGGVTFSFANSISVICVDKDASDVPTAQATSGGITSTGTTLNFNPAGYNIYIYGLSAEINNNGARNVSLCNGNGSSAIYEQCNFRILNSLSSTSSIRTTALADTQTYLHLKNTTLKFNSASNYINIQGRMLFEGVVVEATGTAPTSPFRSLQIDPGGSELLCVGCDFSYFGSAELLANQTVQAVKLTLAQCKLGSGFVMLTTQTEPNRSSGEILILDCQSGDTHGYFAFANALGSIVSDTGIYVTAGAAAQSWKIVTTANCSYYTPFETPWFGYYNTVTTSIAPYVEILRDGSTTAYQDDEVWLDVMAKTTSGSTQSSLTTDRMTLLGTPANHAAGAGLGSWTGESGTAWSGKMVMASLTPAEVGHIQARIVVGEPSITVYADPQVRT